MGRDNTFKATPVFSTTDPYVENSFGVVLKYGDNDIGTFTSVSGGAVEITVIEYTLNAKGRGSQGLLIPGASGPEPVTLSFGVTDDVRFWQWWTDMTEGKAYRRLNLSLVAFGPVYKDGDSYKKRIAEWHLEHAWPVRISGFNFDLDSTSAFIAEVTLAVENISRVTVVVDKETGDITAQPDTVVSASKGYDLGYTE